MSCLVPLLAAAVAAGSARAAQEATRDERPRFRVSVDTVSLAVSVLGEDGQLVQDLPQENFQVFEDGVEQNIQFFSRGELPLRMVILIDTSGSMREKLQLAQEAAVRFARSLKPGDQVQVVEFNDRVLTLAEFTDDFDQVEAAIRQTQAVGATSLYNAMYVSLKDLHRNGSGADVELDRRAMVVLSDGNDTKSVLGFEDVKEQARKGSVVIYAISLRANEEDLKKDKYRNAKYELDMLARETGGVSYAPLKIHDLAGVYEQIEFELKTQYSLGYVSTNPASDGAWRRLQVISKASGTEIRTRAGYFAPRPARKPRRTPGS
ncbi:MAG TPA: VWA domain-containing protein [Vicinamibacteria bacterium]